MSSVESKKPISDFTDLNAWQEARALGHTVYKLTQTFPREEIFALTSQIRLAVVSVSSNIAEGFGRQSDSDKVHFYNMAQTSLDEVRSQLFIALDLGYIELDTVNQAQEKAAIVRKLISGLIRYLKAPK